MTTKHPEVTPPPAVRNRRNNWLLVLMAGSLSLLAVTAGQEILSWRIFPTSFSPDTLLLSDDRNPVVAQFHATFSKAVGKAKTAAGEIASTASTANAVPIDDLKIMDRAATDLQDQIAKRPDDVSLHNRVALMYGSLGDFDAAAQHFQKAIDLSRAKIAALKLQEKAARQMFDYPEASKKLSEIANLNIELSAAHSSLARVYDQMGKHEKVVAQLDQLNSDIVFGAPPEIKKDVPAVAAAVPENKPSDSKTMKSLALGQALMQAHRVPEAIQQFRNYLSLDPTSAFAHEHLGFAYLAVNDPAAAAREFEAAVRLEPGKANYHNELGSALQAIGEADRAQAEYERVLALNPKDAEASFNLGTILSLRGQYDEALDAFRKAVQNNPRSPLAHNHLATMLSFKGDYRDAIMEYQQALRLAPDLASSHYGLGLALYNLKEYPISIRELKRALALNPNLVDAQSKIEIAYRKSGIAAIGRTN